MCETPPVTRPTVRVLALLELLQSGGLHPVRRLADQLGVDERTVRRYVEHLLELEIPIESVRGRYGGYRIGAGYRVPPLMLTEDEAVVAAVSLSAAARARVPGEATATHTALAKIQRVLPAALGRRVEALIASTAQTPTPPPGAVPDASVLLTTAEAAHDRRPIRLQYVDRHGRGTTRRMLPWGLVAHHGHWYVTGPDLESGEHRTFRLDRAARVEVESGRFAVPEGFDSREQVLSGLARTPWRHGVSVLLNADPARIRRQLPEEIARIRPVPPADSPDSAADGQWVRVRLHAERLEWVAAAIAAIDAPFIVEHPDELREAVIALARRLTGYTQGSAPPAE